MASPGLWSRRPWPGGSWQPRARAQSSPTCRGAPPRVLARRQSPACSPHARMAPGASADVRIRRGHETWSLTVTAQQLEPRATRSDAEALGAWIARRSCACWRVITEVLDAWLYSGSGGDVVTRCSRTGRPLARRSLEPGRPRAPATCSSETSGASPSAEGSAVVPRRASPRAFWPVRGSWGCAERIDGVSWRGLPGAASPPALGVALLARESFQVPCVPSPVRR